MLRKNIRQLIIKQLKKKFPPESAQENIPKKQAEQFTEFVKLRHEISSFNLNPNKAWNQFTGRL